MDVNGGNGGSRLSNLAPEHKEVRPSFLRLLAYLLVGAIGALGLWRVEDIANKAQKTSNDFIASEGRKDLQSCQTRNTFQQNTRNKFDHYSDAIEAVLLSGSEDPSRAERVRTFVDQLRKAVETSPEEEDRDCNADGTLDTADYLP